MACKSATCQGEFNGLFGAPKLFASKSHETLVKLIPGFLVGMVVLVILNLQEGQLLIVAALAATLALEASRTGGGRGKQQAVASRGFPQRRVEAVSASEKDPARQSRAVTQFAKSKLAAELTAKDVAARCGPGPTAKVQGPPVVDQRAPIGQPAEPRQLLKFQATGFEAEVQELLAQISRTPEGEQIAEQCVQLVSKALSASLSAAAVLAYVGGNCLAPSEFATASPQIHVALYVDSSAKGPIGCRRKAQKALIRTYTDHLVKVAGFRFRRSAYATDDPLVSLVTPPLPACGDQSISIDFSVNSASPFHMHNLISVVGSLDHRAESLILLVRRWAQDRGIAHITAGHLGEYAWALLTVFFLQVAPGSDVALPPITGASKSEARQAAAARTGALKSTAELFQNFAAFYAKDFDWKNEGISVRLARRAGPQIPVHFVVEGGKKEIAPTIEDPFNLTKNLGDFMKIGCMDSLHKEFGRAHELCARMASLSELLEPWMPEAKQSTKP